MLRHEQQTVRMALAAALHHSAGPREKVEKQQNGAPRGQKTAARAREEVEHATHYGPRAQETPPPGERPGILAEPGPQRSDRSRRHSSGECLPTLGLPVLAGASGEQVDASTLRYLLAHAIEMRKVLEEGGKEEGGGTEEGGPLLSFFGAQEDEEEKEEATTSTWGTNTAMWAWAPLSLFVVWCLLGIMAGVCQKDSCALLVNSGSGLCKVGFTGDYAPRSMFPSVDDRPQMLDIMAGTDQKNFYVDIGCMLGWICW